MFKRALKVKFNEQKFMQLSTMQMYRMPYEKVHSTGKRLATAFGLSFVLILIKYQRKSHTHKVCYTPLKYGLNEIKNDPEYGPVERMGIYGYLYSSEGRSYI